MFAKLIKMFPDGVYICLENGMEIESPRRLNDDELEKYGETVLVSTSIKSGGGASIGKIKEWIKDWEESPEIYWLPAAVTRGHRAATEQELGEVPSEIANAYRWRFT